MKVMSRASAKMASWVPSGPALKLLVSIGDALSPTLSSKNPPRSPTIPGRVGDVFGKYPRRTVTGSDEASVVSEPPEVVSVVPSPSSSLRAAWRR